ncbi:MAG: GTP-sensing pleiotropic transcriptional regulator CodY [Acidaminococcales bacterium]|jgi:transcriptional pleiotropic repressor|nr:GTP-sensing pleiotropic transcriptional regulator CodY [Acidaminococcales bacterium]
MEQFSLLEKTRKISKLLQKSGSVDYNDLARLLGDILSSNIYISSKAGEILGYSLLDGFECGIMLDKVVNIRQFPENYVEWLMKVTETTSNIALKKNMCAFSQGTECLFGDKRTTLIPVYGNGERIGTLVIGRFDSEYTDGDLLVAEYGATVVGVEILRERTEKIEEYARKKATVQVALATLSYSELEAMIHILNELESSEGLLVASKIADRVGITRSVIVNALRKFESAGVIESKSLGMKGTYIKILNDLLLPELKKIR